MPMALLIIISDFSKPMTVTVNETSPYVTIDSSNSSSDAITFTIGVNRIEERDSQSSVVASIKMGSSFTLTR